MSRDDLGDYSSVNEAWGPGPLPKLTGEEALRAAKRLYSKWIGHAWRGDWKLTSGRRYTWPRGGTFYVNPKSWSSLVHLLSHYCHRQLNPSADSHDAAHAVIEFEMVEHVKASGWLDGKLRPTEKPKSDPVQEKLKSVLRRIEKWESKERRAATALKKLRRQKAYYEKRAATREETTDAPQAPSPAADPAPEAGADPS